MQDQSRAYVSVPKDLVAVKTKVLFNLTKRQLICFGSGALVGVPLFFLLKGPAGLSVSSSSMCMVFVMLPFFLLAVYEKDGLPLEKIIHNIARVLFIRPKQRPYMTNNYYAAALEIYITGPLSVFNHRTKVDTQNRVVIYDIGELGGMQKNRDVNRAGAGAFPSRRKPCSGKIHPVL